MSADPRLERLSSQLQAGGDHRYGAWRPQLFAQICQGPARQLWQGLQGQPQALATTRAYLELVSEAIGCGLLLDLPRPEAARKEYANLLSWALLVLLPSQLPSVEARAQLDALATTFNLGEGLSQEPAWLDRFLLSRLTQEPEQLELSQLGARMQALLEPVLRVMEPSQFAGPFDCRVLDCAQAHAEFLPGDIWQAGPSVLCVRDRVEPLRHLGLLLGGEQGCELLGVGGDLGRFESRAQLPQVRLDDRGLQLGDARVELSHLISPRQALVHAGGYVVVSAQDSQQLWVVESAA